MGKIRQLVLKAHDDFDRHTERDTHVLPAAEVLRGKLVEMSLVDAFDRKEDPFKSFEVIWLRTVTLGTFGLGGAAVDSTHDGGFDFFFGGIAVCLWSVMYNPSTDRYSGTEQEPPGRLP